MTRAGAIRIGPPPGNPNTADAPTFARLSKRSGGRPRGRVTSTARSATGSKPTTVAADSTPLPSTILTSLLPATTCALVTTTDCPPVVSPATNEVPDWIRPQAGATTRKVDATTASDTASSIPVASGGGPGSGVACNWSKTCGKGTSEVKRLMACTASGGSGNLASMNRATPDWLTAAATEPLKPATTGNNNHTTVSAPAPPTSAPPTRFTAAARPLRLPRLSRDPMAAPTALPAPSAPANAPRVTNVARLGSRSGKRVNTHGNALTTATTPTTIQTHDNNLVTRPRRPPVAAATKTAPTMATSTRFNDPAARQTAERHPEADGHGSKNRCGPASGG